MTPDPSATDPNTGLPYVQPGDAIVIRNKADAPNTSDPTSISDAGYVNALSQDGSESGRWPGCWRGGRQPHPRDHGHRARHAAARASRSNTATGLTWDLPLLMDETSVWIIETPSWQYSADSTTADQSAPNATASLVVPVDNFINQPMVIAAFTVDINGNESPDGDAPIREDWIYGADSTVWASSVLPSY